MRTRIFVLTAALAALAAGQTTPALTPSPAALSFTWQEGSALPASQTVSVKGGASNAAYTTAVVPAGQWLSVSVDSGALPANMAVEVNPSGLPVGTYNASVQVTATGFANPAVIPVTLIVTAPLPTLALSAASVSFVSPPNPPASQTLQLTTTGGPIEFNAVGQGVTWLTVAPTSGVVLPGVATTLTISVNPTGLDPSATAYAGKIAITASGVPSANKSQIVSVSLLVNSLTPTIASLWPSAALAGTGALSVTVRGTGFYKATTVSAVGVQTAIQTTFVSPTTVIAAIPASLTASAGTLNLVATNPAPGGASQSSPFTVSATPVVQAVVNAASYSQGAAPGELVTLFGFGIGPTAPLSMNIVNGVAATTVNNVWVTIDSLPAALVYASANQVTVQVPYEVTIAAARAVAVNNNGTLAAGQVDASATNPGIFSLNGSGTGQAAALTFSMKTGLYTINGQSSPALPGDILVLYVTGEGAYAGAAIPVPDGFIVPSSLSPLPQVSPLPTVTIGGAAATVQYAGPLVGGILGALQINAVVPAGSTTGNAVPVSVSIGGATSQPGVTVAVK